MKQVALSVVLCFSVLGCLAQVLTPYKDDATELYGYKNDKGKVVIKPIYKKAYPFAEGLAVVCDENKKSGCINEKGKVAIPFIYDESWATDCSFKDGLLLISKNKKFGFINKEGKEVIPFKYGNADNFSEDLAFVVEGDVYSMSRPKYFIDKTGKKIFDVPYLIVDKFKNGVCKVSNKGLTNYYDGYIDKTGKEIIPVKYQSIEFQKDGYIGVKEDGKYGWLNKSYELFIPTLYRNSLNVKQFTEGKEGLVALNLDGLWGFADATGSIIIPFQFEFITEEFKNGVAVVGLKGERFSIDVTGKRIEGTTTVVKKQAVRETITDVDGKKYFTVKIGTQTWMASNLTVQHYRNGDPIQLVTDDKTWRSTTAGAACFYNNDKELDFGVDLFYNTYTITDSRNVCPVGWHIPSPAESRLLIKTVQEVALTSLTVAERQTYDAATERGISTAAFKDALAASALQSTALWMKGQNGTNSSGFNLTPTGMRNEFGQYIFRGQFGYFWTIKKESKATGETFQLRAGEITWRTASPTLGYPIRCVKD